MTGSNPDSDADSLFDDLHELLSGQGDDDARRRVREAILDPENPFSLIIRRPVRDRPFAEDWPPAEFMSLSADDAREDKDSGKADLQSGDNGSWLAIPLQWQGRDDGTTVAFAVALLSMIHRRVRLMPFTHMSKGANSVSETESDRQGIRQSLEHGDPLIASDSEHWIHTIIEGDTFVIRVGFDSANRFERFSIEFRSEDEVVLRLETDDGVVRIDRNHFVKVYAASDNLTIEEIR